MSRILVAVDGSAHAEAAVKWVINHVKLFRDAPELELVHVHAPLPYINRVKQVIAESEIQRYYKEEGEDALREARRLLDQADIPYKVHNFVGPIAKTLVEHANRTHSTLIVMGTRGMGAVGNLVLGSVATRVLHAATIPVLLVPQL